MNMLKGGDWGSGPHMAPPSERGQGDTFRTSSSLHKLLAAHWLRFRMVIFCAGAWEDLPGFQIGDLWD